MKRRALTHPYNPRRRPFHVDLMTETTETRQKRPVLEGIAGTLLPPPADFNARVDFRGVSTKTRLNQVWGEILGNPETREPLSVA